MKKVELYKGIKSSVLGFGCSPILGAVDGNRARVAIEKSLECGINHFDLARSYGYGEAEKFVGKVLGNRRSDVVIASKFGIKANLKAKLLIPIKPIVRAALSFKRQLFQSESNASQHQVKLKTLSVADKFHYRISLNGKEMRKSLEETLKALNSDYLDYFFVHEPLDTLSYIDELSRVAEDMKKEGKIRAWGLAYTQDQKELHVEYLDRFDVLQFNNAVGIEGYENIVNDRQNDPNIFFSSLRGGDSDLSTDQKLTRLNQDFPNSVILCSMYNEKHIVNNASLFN